MHNATIPKSDSVRSNFSISSRTLWKQNTNAQVGKYTLGSTIGQGEFGKVKLCWAEVNGTRQQFAMKIIKSDALKSDAQKLKFSHEMKALETCRHPNIIRLRDSFRYRNNIALVLDYASGGDMFNYIYKNGRLDEVRAKKHFAQLISGVAYLHHLGIVHRDLKLENLLLDGNQNVMISDFGFANSIKGKNGMSRLMKTACGSPCYAAPEVVNSTSNYDGRKADVWSSGVILFTFLAGYLPFDDDPNNPDSEDVPKLYEYITKTPLKFPESVGVVPRDLLRSILVVNPDKRMGLNDIKSHVWLSDHSQFLSITPAEHEGGAHWQQKQRRPSQQLQQPQQPQQQQQYRQHYRAPSTASVQTQHYLSTAAAAAAMPSPTRVKAQREQEWRKSISTEVTGLAISNPPRSHETTHRLAQTSKPRPVSLQMTSSANKFTDSIYTPTSAKPRVALSREPSKSGEISRPEYSQDQKANDSAEIHRQRGHQRTHSVQQPARPTIQRVNPQRYSFTPSSRTQPNQSYAHAPSHARPSTAHMYTTLDPNAEVNRSMNQSANQSYLDRSSSLQSIPSHTPQRKSYITPPTNIQTIANSYSSTHVNKPVVQSHSPQMTRSETMPTHSPLSTHSPRMPDYDTPSARASHAHHPAPPPVAAAAPPADLPQSRSKFRLSSMFNKPAKTESGQRVPSPATHNRRASHIPVSSTQRTQQQHPEKEGMFKKTLNIFRRSMVG